MLKLFVYGSLKPRESNWWLVEEHVRAFRPARVPGRLYLRETGYPTLWVPPEAVLREGRTDRQADLELTRRLATEPADVGRPRTEPADSEPASRPARRPFDYELPQEASPDSERPRQPLPPRPAGPPQEPAGECWVEGFLLELPADPGLFERLDDFEDFDPARPDAQYRRALVAAMSEAGGEAAWAYLCTQQQAARSLGSWQPIARWPRWARKS